MCAKGQVRYPVIRNDMHEVRIDRQLI